MCPGRTCRPGTMGTRQTSAQAAHAEPNMTPESSKQMDRVSSPLGAAGQLVRLSPSPLTPRKELRFARQRELGAEASTSYFTEQETEARRGEEPAQGLTVRPVPVCCGSQHPTPETQREGTLTLHHAQGSGGQSAAACYGWRPRARGMSAAPPAYPWKEKPSAQ